MPVTFSLPELIEESLRSQVGDLDATAKEAALLELYRRGKLSHGELALSLGLSRDEVNSLLKLHNVTEDLPTLAEFDAQLAVVRRRLAP